MRTERSNGFTLIEVLLISPILILFIGAFIGLIVTLTGDSLKMRQKNSLSYDIQAALADIESNVTASKTFVSTTGAVPSPQGSADVANDTTAFSNINTGATDTLILSLVATDRNPTDSTRSPIYASATCASSNPTYNYYVIYFVKSQKLFKRTILPAGTRCATPWQRGSCLDSLVSTNTSVCQRKDDELIADVTNLTMNVDYYLTGTATSTTSYTNAPTAVSLNIAIGGQRMGAGQALQYTGTSRISRVR
jgi:hypothetical protein